MTTEVTDNADSQDGSAKTEPLSELAPPTPVEVGDDLDTLVLKFGNQITTLITKLHHKEVEFDFANSMSNQYQEQFKAQLTSLINQTVSKELERLHRFDGKDYDTELDEYIDELIEFYRGKS